MEHEWPHVGEIDCIELPGTPTGFYRVGRNGVTRIEAAVKSGMHSHIAYVRVWKGDNVHSEHCQHGLVGVYFKAPA